MIFKILIRMVIFMFLLFSMTLAKTVFVNGYNDGISVYVTIKSNGHIYKTNEVGPATNAKLWKLLDSQDKKKLLHYYYRPGLRNVDFGPSARSMAKWANDTSGWSALIEALKQKRAGKSYPTLKAFYSKKLIFPTASQNMKCTEQILNTQLAQEVKELKININENYLLGQQIYKKLINIKWNQISVAVKGISGNLIPVIVDNFMTGFITNGASQMSQLVANLYSFAKSTSDFAKNKPNDAAELIKKLSVLCDMMETDAKTAKMFVEKDKEKLKVKSEQLAKLCKLDYEQKVKFEREKSDVFIKSCASPTINTNLKITSDAKTKEKREEEIRRKVDHLLRHLSVSLNDTEVNGMNKFKDLSKDLSNIKYPKNPKFCNNKVTHSFNNGKRIISYLYKMPASSNDSCFSMRFSVEEIREWQKDFSRYIPMLKTNLHKYQVIFNTAKHDYKTISKKVTNLQGRMNELINKYRSYIPSYIKPKYSVHSDLSYFNNFIEKIEKDIKITKIRIKVARVGINTIKKRLAKRIDREKNLIKPYGSLEDNFVSSLIQIRDAIARIDRIYKSYVFIDLHAHIPRVDYKKLSQLSVNMPEKKLDNIVKKLKKDQLEIRHQVKRLIIGQNNAVYDYNLLEQFIRYYTGMVKLSPFVKKDVLEVTGVSIKDPYYDIVQDWSNGDPSLWMQGKIGNWLLKPQVLLLDIDYIISRLHGKGKSYQQLENIYNKLKKNKTLYLAMNSKNWSNTFNLFSSNIYKITQSQIGLTNKTTNDMIAKVYNLLHEIANVIIARERVANVMPILKKSIKDAQELLIKKGQDNATYDAMIYRLKNDIKHGTEAYYGRTIPVIAEATATINTLIDKLKNSKEKNIKIFENDQIEKIKDFYKNFKEAYESKDVASVTANLSSNWSSSSDGTDISELDDYLSRSFKIFDEIEYDISSLNIHHLQNNRYKVLYNVNIIGRIYDDDIVHEEKSLVQEEVCIKNGKVKIEKTLGGEYWSIK